MLSAWQSAENESVDLVNFVRARLEDPTERILFIEELLKYGEEEEYGYFLSGKTTIPSSVIFEKRYDSEETFSLPSFEPCAITLHDLIYARKSVREYGTDPVPLTALSALLTYSYGVRKIAPSYNHPTFTFRTAPSAGGLQSTEVYVIAQRVGGLKPGVYHYNARRNCLEKLFEGLLRGKMRSLCSQEMVAEAGVVVVLTMMLPRGTWKYLARYYKFALVDIGCVAENFHLVATALGFGSCIVAAFQQEGVAKMLQLDRNELPTLLLSIGSK